MASNVDYDYDKVIALCQNQAQEGILDLATNLNELSNVLTSCEDCFHDKGGTGAVSEIYDGFSNIIGSTKEKRGLSAFVQESASIVNTAYSEALYDKGIIEEIWDYVTGKTHKENEEKERQWEEQQKRWREKKRKELFGNKYLNELEYEQAKISEKWEEEWLNSIVIEPRDVAIAKEQAQKAKEQK